MISTSAFSMEKFLRFVPITKVDKEKRMVYGWATTPDLDSDGEKITLDAVAKALPGYMQFPTIREMHQAKAAGTTIEAEIRDDKKQKGLYIGAKIVAEDAWQLVKEGVYRAFSIGGHVTQKMKNVIHGLELVEISLVDVPANKAAVIELWKRGDIGKSAETVYSLSQLMIQIKDTIYYYDYLGKDTKKLGKALELIKQMIALEAEEPEPKLGESGVEAQATVSYIKQRIKTLESMDFEDKTANLIRRGVINAMSKKLEELDKSNASEEEKDRSEAGSDEEQADKDGAENSSNTLTPEGEKDPKAGAEEDQNADDEDPSESEEEDEVVEDEEDKQSAASTTLQKINDSNKRLDKLNPAKKSAEKLTIEKSVNALAGTIAKVVDTLTGIDERLAKLESTPAAPKSRAAYVKRGESVEGDSSDKKTESPELETKKRRLAELDKLFSTMTRHEFANKGLSAEAQRLESEIEQLRGGV